jgi:adenylylsulfate kinase
MRHDDGRGRFSGPVLRLQEPREASDVETRTPNITWHAGNVTRDDRRRLLGQRGVTLWLTGLSASGKSTIACIVERKLIDRRKLAYRLDGDNVRHGLNNNLGFSAADRAENIRRIGEVANLFTDAGVIVLASFISPYRRDRDAVRALMPAGDFVEVYVKASVEAAERRDPKGLYKKARAGEIKNFTGLDDPYEVPENPEIVVDTEALTPDQAADEIAAYLDKGGYLNP